MHTDKTSLNEVSERSIACVFTVANIPVSGFREKVYENALPGNSQRMA